MAELLTVEIFAKLSKCDVYWIHGAGSIEGAHPGHPDQRGSAVRWEPSSAGLLATLDRLLPETARNTDEGLRRGRLLVGAAFLLCAVVFVDAAFQSLREGSLSAVEPLLLLITLAAALVLLLVPIWLRLTKSLDASAFIVVLTVLLWILSVGWTGDRLHGPVLLLLPMVPILVTFLWNERVGGTVTLLLFLGLSLGRGSSETNSLLHGSQGALTTQMLASVVLLAGGFAWLYERQRLRAERRLRYSTDLYQRLFEQSKDVVMVVSTEGEIRDINAAGLELYGYDSLEEIKRHNIESFYVDLAERREMLARLEQEGWLQAHELRHRTRQGRIIHVQGTVSVMRGSAGKVSDLMVILRDVTQERRVQEGLVKMARFDSLTGLANRYTFQDQLEKTLARASRFRRRMALLMLDLDRFKEVNDQYGHDVGDALLMAASDRLSSCIRKVDTVARLGGDELAVIKTDFDEPEHAAMLARRLLLSLEQPFEIDGLQIQTSVSIGIAVYPPGESDSQALIKQADLALYRAKRDGRNTFRFYDQDIGNEVKERMELAQDLSQVLDENELYLEFQPQVDLGSKRVTGVEALLRWRHPQHGIISPVRFISIAEDSGMMGKIGEWVLRTACREARRWREDLKLPVPVAVNLAGSQLRDPELPERVAAILSEVGLSGDAVEMEMTAGQLRQLPRGSSRRLQELGELGIRLTLDDFGSAPVALEELQRLPMGKVKIDPSFVHRLERDEDADALVKAATSVAQKLGLTPVAEGVETGRQARFLENIGCYDVLGHLISRPLPCDSLLELIALGSEQLRPWSQEDSGPVRLPGPASDPVR